MSTPSLHVFEPPMCCSSGVCGPSVDPALAKFAGSLKWLQANGVAVTRSNLSQDAAAFVSTEAVRSALTLRGESALPIILVNGRIEVEGRYPSKGELAAIFNLNLSDSPTPPPQPTLGC